MYHSSHRMSNVWIWEVEEFETENNDTQIICLQTSIARDDKAHHEILWK